MSWRLTIFTLSFFVIYFVGNAQNSKETRVIKWVKPTEQKNNIATEKTSLQFEGAAFVSNKDRTPVYVEAFPLPNKQIKKVTLVNTVYTGVSAEESKNLKNISETVDITVQTGYERSHPRALISFVPLRKNPVTGKIEKLTSFSYEIEYDQSVQNVRSAGSTRSYAKNSVLSTGDWYKLAISQNGIYKLGYSYLKDLGINVDQIDPKNIKIYGNGGGMLPEANAEFRYDDLQENAIEVIGEADGKFNTGDYILFYAEGADKWEYQEGKKLFRHEENLYAAHNYYFLNISPGQGKRIATTSSLNTNPTHTVTTFDDFLKHEESYVNLIQSGREWYGENFDINTSQNFKFTFPNLMTSNPVYIRSRAVARSTTTSSSFSVNANGQTVSTLSMSKVGSYYLDKYAQESEKTDSFNTTSGSIDIGVTYNKPNSGALAWLDFIELNATRDLKMYGSQMAFRDTRSVGKGNISQFTISNATPNLKVWEITDPLNISNIEGETSGSTFAYTLSADSLRSFIAFDGSKFNAPEKAAKIGNQNLHATSQPDMVIAVHPKFIAEAERLAEFHRSWDGLEVLVVNVEQIYNEFSSGRQDPSAIRDFMKMLYDRAAGDESKMPRYLLLFGDGSYDYKDYTKSNTNYIPAYESWESLQPTATFVSDDFYGFLDDEEGDYSSIVTRKRQIAAFLDIGIGRFPVSSVAEAKAVVDKMIHYASNAASFGSWRNAVTFVADDEDNNLHINDANTLADFVGENYNSYNIDKIFFDAFPQESTPAGARYPMVREAINSKIYSGTLIMGYTGHGGEIGWAHERVLNISDINAWDNLDKLPLFMTATCEFSRYDDPGRTSAGELLLTKSDGGAIALFTTVRVVYAGDNQNLAVNFYKVVFDSLENEMPRLGDIARISKNNANPGVNNRKFALLGDPALRLAYPKYRVVTESVSSDTLKALGDVTVKGYIHDGKGKKLDNFNGLVYPTIYDKASTVPTLQNDPDSRKRTFKLRKNILYKGKASVTNGDFTFTFVVPKDIAYNFDYGRISYYADDDKVDATGTYDSVIVGGTAEEFAKDDKGPDIDIFLNDEKFVFGGLTNETPLLIVKIADSSGINTVGNGIGHDLTGKLDDKDKNLIILNEFYEANVDDHTSGEVRYPLSELSAGRHNIKVKAWDVYNNSSEGYSEFVVAESAEMALKHVLNYPNPFTTNTNFQFEHNRPGDILQVDIQIYTISGKLVKTIFADILTDGTRVDNIQWNGLDDFGNRIGRGVYVYRVRVKGSDGATADQFEKLVILN